MTHSRKNYSKRAPACADDDVFEDCNLSQRRPFTQICAGRHGLEFIGCNLVNCQLPADSTITACNVAQIEFDRVQRVVEIEGERLEIVRAVRVGRGVL